MRIFFKGVINQLSLQHIPGIAFVYPHCCGEKDVIYRKIFKLAVILRMLSRLQKIIFAELIGGQYFFIPFLESAIIESER